MMGRTAIPAESHVIRGSFRPARHAHGPKVPVGAPKCPVWLPKAAKRYWKDLAPGLVDAGLVSVVDGAAFVVHCDSMGRYEEVIRRLASLEDCLSETPNGYSVQSALFTIRNKLWEQVIVSAREFGLTPAARSSKVRQAGDPKLPLGGDDWDKL